jgi:hypothetical protein
MNTQILLVDSQYLKYENCYPFVNSDDEVEIIRAGTDETVVAKYPKGQWRAVTLLDSNWPTK